MRNTFGNIFTLTTFGESHGEAVGGIIDGMPAGIEVDMDFIQHQLDRRRPGQSQITTQRKEPDHVELLSGVYQGKTTGTPIGFISGTQISDLPTITIWWICFVLLMPIIPTTTNMDCVIPVEAGVLLPASRSAVVSAGLGHAGFATVGYHYPGLHNTSW